MKEILGYTRVSTSEQGKSGLGLEAQKASIEAFAARNNLTVLEWFTDVKSGKRVSDTLDERPALQRALHMARESELAVVVSRLDRLSRDVYFISGLMSKKVPFYVAELGMDVEPFMLHIHAALAEKERSMISERTRAALKALKARGVQLGPKIPHKGINSKGRQAHEREWPFLQLLLSKHVGPYRLEDIARECAVLSDEPWNKVRVHRAIERARRMGCEV